ncbi:MAG: hypothetical protein QM831_31535 [Kofleriaceae bacterium]
MIDLLEAREQYHVHLSSVPTVVGTAIGRYRIREDDWYATHPPTSIRVGKKPEGPRTFENSVVRPWSWPCVIVMVNHWFARGKDHPKIDKQLYMPDGRVIPTCVVYAPPDEQLPRQPDVIGASSNLIGGGYACTRTAQGETRAGTIGCIVEREGSYFALTNRHVAGPDGGEVDAVIRTQRVAIGRSSTQAISRVPMREVFPAWPASDNFANIDAGLIEIDDISRWTSQVFGVGEIAEPFDASLGTISLDMIGCPVRAYGGTSGLQEGEIQALFVRYKSLGGYDYISDLLIGQRKPQEKSHTNGAQPKVETRPGDSGTLWFYDPPNNPSEDVSAVLPPEPPPEQGRRARRLVPIAMQWGAQNVNVDGNRSTHALATFVSTVCRMLDVEIVHGYGTGHGEYWGKIGHFSIGWKACEQIDPKFDGLAKLMLANQRNIGFPDATIEQGKEFRVGRDGFVPLADVPDYVWIADRRRQNEGEQHFADIDIVAIDGGPSLIDRCVEDPANISATVWRDYFNGFESKGVGPDEGALPFRVWQLWDEMVAALAEERLDRFIVAAGTCAHYIGDASQPLHCSWLHHGRPPTTKVGNNEYPPRKARSSSHPGAYEAFHKTPAAKIHGLYEETMLELQPEVALAGVDKNLEARDRPPADLTSGFHAAKLVIDLMQASRTRLSPEEIIAADDPEAKPAARTHMLWNDAKVRDGTIASLADSTYALARLWQSAWVVGNGAAISRTKLKQLDESALMALYKSLEFAPAQTLEQLADSGRYEATVTSNARVTPSKPSTRKKKPKQQKRSHKPNSRK